MTIEFNNERDLIEGIISSGVNLFTFATFFLDEFGITLCKTHQDILQRVESRSKQSRDTISRWKSNGIPVYTESDIPAWITTKVETNAQPRNLHQTITEIVNYIPRNAPMLNNFAKLMDGYYFTKDGFCFLIDRLTALHYLAHEDNEKWRMESGFYDFLYRKRSE